MVFPCRQRSPAWKKITPTYRSGVEGALQAVPRTIQAQGPVQRVEPLGRPMGPPKVDQTRRIDRGRGAFGRQVSGELIESGRRSRRVEQLRRPARNRKNPQRFMRCAAEPDRRQSGDAAQTLIPCGSLPAVLKEGVAAQTGPDGSGPRARPVGDCRLSWSREGRRQGPNAQRGARTKFGNHCDGVQRGPRLGLVTRTGNMLITSHRKGPLCHETLFVVPGFIKLNDSSASSKNPAGDSGQMGPRASPNG